MAGKRAGASRASVPRAAAIAARRAPPRSSRARSGWSSWPRRAQRPCTRCRRATATCRPPARTHTHAHTHANPDASHARALRTDSARTKR
eukprot:4454661-Pleurochrysis_carterae.AAC.4